MAGTKTRPKDTRQVVWSGTFEGAAFGSAWADVSCARGRKTDAPATRAVRIALGPDGVTLAAFSREIMLYSSVSAKVETCDLERQIAAHDVHGTLADLIAGMKREGGPATIELRAMSTESVDGGTLWQPEELSMRWNATTVMIPIAEMDPADYMAVAGLLALQPDPMLPEHPAFEPNVLKRLAAIGQIVAFRFFGDGMPVGISCPAGLQGAVLAHVVAVDSLVSGPTASELVERTYRFLDVMRPARKEKDLDGDDVPSQEETLDDALDGVVEGWETPDPDRDGPAGPEGDAA